MAIDTAEKRRAASGLQFIPLPEVTPNVNKDEEWRAQAVGAYLFTLIDYAITLNQGSYTLTGQTVGLLSSRLVTSSQGSYVLTGQAVGLISKRVLSLVTGTYTLTGQDVTFTLTSAQNHFLYGTLSWNAERENVLLVANDNTIYLVGMIDLQDRRNADGSPKYLDSGVTVTWEIRDAVYPGGTLVADGTGTLTNDGGAARIDISEDVALTPGNVYWLNVMFSNNVGNGLISARFIARTRTGRTRGT